MKLLLQFPTLGRPDKFVKCLEKYVTLSSNENSLHFNINCDEIDTTMKDNKVLSKIDEIVSKCSNVTYNINFDHNTTKISAINSHISNKDFDIVVCLSDDMIPMQQNWDKIISDKMQEYFPDTDGCLHFNDGYQGDRLITLSILGKKLYEHFGYIYHPDYKTLYSDDEFTQEVKRLNKIAYFDETIISHEHYSRENNINSGDYDYAAQKTMYYAGRDGVVFNKRKQLGFPKHKITND